MICDLGGIEGCQQAVGRHDGRAQRAVIRGGGVVVGAVAPVLLEAAGVMEQPDDPGDQERARFEPQGPAELRRFHRPP